MLPLFATRKKLHLFKGRIPKPQLFCAQRRSFCTSHDDIMNKRRADVSETQSLPSEEKLPSTRVFVSGLPPKLTSEQLGLHFGTKFQVTDSHVVADRRIGFVGFVDSTAAEDAVKHFNKSYIRMSKISVDLAEPVQVLRDTSGNAIPQSKRGVGASLKHANVGVNKRKRSDQDDGEDLRTASTNNAAPNERNTDTQATFHDGETVEIDDTTNLLDAKGADDNDWLRGKTSRLLDLVDPDAVHQTDNPGGRGIELQKETQVSNDSVKEETVQNPGQNLDKAAVRVANGRLFLRNLAFNVTDKDLQKKFSEFGKVQEAHVVKDARSSSSKGTAFVQFADSDEAEAALEALDGVAFHGRLLHILPASDKRDTGLTEYDISQMPLKKQKAIRKKLAASNATFSWNSLYMNPDAVLSSIADRLGVSKADILDPTSADAAIKQAHAETQLIKETKAYLSSNGVNIEAFKNDARDERSLLLKNFQYGTSEDELRELLDSFGIIRKFLLPPSGTMAVVQYEEPHSASQALKNLAYKNIKGSVLFLEKAPRGLLDMTKSSSIESTESAAQAKPLETTEVAEKGPSTTVFIRNLNFSTSNGRLMDLTSSLPGFLNARIKTRTDVKRPGEILSMGFGFVEFKTKSQAEAAVAALNGHNLDGHNLIVQLSNKGVDLAEEQRKQDTASRKSANQTKIIIKNLPFQTSKKDIRSLFSQYGQLKTVRVPRKFDNTTRGFAFAEFVTPKEAENAMEALSNTHLLGRRLVLQFAQEDSIDPEDEIRAIEKKVEQQNNRIQLSKLLSGSSRKKFNVDGSREEQTA